MDERQSAPTTEEKKEYRKPPSKKRRKKKASPEKVLAIVLASLALLLVLAALSAGAFVLYTGSLHGNMFAAHETDQMQKVRSQAEAAATPSPTPLLEQVDADWIDSEGRPWNRKENVLTVLLMGVDYMGKASHWENGQKNGGNTDVLALLILDLDANSAKVLYIPRDTMADVLALDEEGNFQSMLYTNITTAHSFGDGGVLSCELTEHAVSGLLCGAEIDRYVSVDYDAIGEINTLLGGVEYTLDADYSWIDWRMTEGATVRLESWQLRRLLSYRDKSELDGAYRRGQRDLKIMRAMFEQFKTAFREDPSVTFRMYSALEKYLVTDLSMDEISFLAQTLVNIQLDSDCVINLPGENQAGEEYVEFYPDLDWIQTFAAETFYVPAESNG